MPTGHDTIRAPSGRPKSVGLWLLCLALSSGWACADVLDPGPTLQTALQIKASTALEISGGRSAHFSTIGAQFSLEHSSSRLPVHSGVFADFNVSSESHAPFFQVLGGWTSYSNGRWSLTTSAAYFSTKTVSGTWIYLQKLQFEIRPGHKLALTAFGSLESSRRPGLRLVYKTKFADRFSVELGVGIGKNRPLDIGASSSMTWNLL